MRAKRAEPSAQTFRGLAETEVGVVVTFKQHAISLTKGILVTIFMEFPHIFKVQTLRKKFYANEHLIILGLKLAA